MRALSIKGLKKIYPNGIEALSGIDLDVDEGEFFALLGPNGAGKTTAIGIVTALVNKTGGSVEVFGHDIDRSHTLAKSCIGLVPQEINLNLFEKVLSIVVTQAGYYGIPHRVAMQRAEKYLGELQLWDRRDDIARGLSGGMKRRLMIARGLVHEPRLLILDEPTAGVDVELRRGMWDFLEELNSEGITIILTTHYLEEAERLCSRIAIISDGRIIENTDKRELLKKLDKETFVFDVKADELTIAPLENVRFTQLDSTTLEVTIRKGQLLNRVFEHLGNQGVVVESLRNKTNRLEEIFMEMVE